MKRLMFDSLFITSALNPSFVTKDIHSNLCGPLSQENRHNPHFFPLNVLQIKNFQKYLYFKAILFYTWRSHIMGQILRSHDQGNATNFTIIFMVFDTLILVDCKWSVVALVD